MKHYKKLFLVFAMLFVHVIPTMARNYQEGNWVIAYNSDTNLLTLINQGKTIVKDAYSKATYDDSTHVGLSIDTRAARLISHGKQKIADMMGKGVTYSFIYEQNNVRLIQKITLYEDYPFLIAQMCLSGKNGKIKSNYLVPLCSDSSNELLPADGSNRMLWVPWDNDAWVRYQAYTLTKSITPFSVTSIYNASSRYGVVIGAIDHDIWKSAIHIKASNNNQIDTLALISGYVDANSRDSIPHGKVVGDTVSSARFVIGCFADWRKGMEAFASACQKVVPGRTWQSGALYGWNSWGVMQEKVNYQGVIDCMHYIHDNLMPHGFHDNNGRVLISLDSYYSNLSDEQLKRFVDSCKQLNMIPGIYMCPFADWAKWDRAIPGTSKYTYKDLWLKRNGKYPEIATARCLDPTHPGTKIAIKTEIDKWKRMGIKYIKMDFMCNGALECDGWFDKNVHTGIQAYNEGMAFIRKQCGDSIFVDLSISPLFPYQYAEGRRISCDAYSSIDNTQYVLNSTSFGWWLDGLYALNDPDNLVMKSKYHNGLETKGENRARITSGAITGMFTTSDNYSDAVSYGYPGKSRELALTMYRNEDINEIARTCKSFYPVEGDESKTDGAENLLMYENDKYVYLAVINYYPTLTHVTGKITFERLGIAADEVDSIKELWTGAIVNSLPDGFNYDVPAKDARIYRIQKKTSSSIVALPMEEPTMLSSVWYTVDGLLLGTTRPKRQGVYLVRQTDKINHCHTRKVLIE